MATKLRFEPAMLAAFVEAVLVMVAAFGLGLDGGQIASVVTVVNIGVAMFVRQATVTKAALNELEALPAAELEALKSANV